MKQKTKALLVDILGFGCIIASPLLGWLPGPGGIPLLIIGLSLLANNHEWAEKLLAKVKEHAGNATKKVSQSSPVVRLAIDILSVVLIAIAVLIMVYVTRDLFKAAAISLIIVAVVLTFTNQNRYKRAWNKFTRKHKR